MTATVTIEERNGVGETATDKTSGTIRFKKADDASVDLADPLVIPDTGQDYSYEKWLMVKIATGTGFSQITNVKAYMDGANGFGTGVKLWQALDAAYSTPVQPSTADDPPHHDAVDMTDMFASTVGSPLTLDAGPITVAADISNYLVLVMEAEAAATQGVTANETLTISYDEI